MSIPETGQNPKSEARNPKQIQKAERKKIQNGSAGLNDLSFPLWICFGFRHSCFGFFSLPCETGQNPKSEIRSTKSETNPKGGKEENPKRQRRFE